LYAVTGGVNRRPARGLVFDMLTGGLTETFADASVDGRLDRPHDIAVSDDGREILIVDLGAPERVFKLIDTRIPEPVGRPDPIMDFNRANSAQTSLAMALCVIWLLKSR